MKSMVWSFGLRWFDGIEKRCAEADDLFISCDLAFHATLAFYAIVIASCTAVVVK